MRLFTTLVALYLMSHKIRKDGIILNGFVHGWVPKTRITT
jgi:hypothetical protein